MVFVFSLFLIRVASSILLRGTQHHPVSAPWLTADEELGKFTACRVSQTCTLPPPNTHTHKLPLVLVL